MPRLVHLHTFAFRAGPGDVIGECYCGTQVALLARGRSKVRCRLVRPRLCDVPGCTKEPTHRLFAENERRGMTFVIVLCHRHAAIANEERLRELAEILDAAVV